MMMVRRRSTALRTVVEECESVIFAGEVQHVDISFPYRLVCVAVHRNHQMVRKNRIRIYEDMIFLSLASVKLDKHLFLRSVLSAEEALSRRYLLFAELCGRRNYPRRIELKLHGQSSDLHFPHLHVLQSTVVITCKRPARKLVSYELMYYLVVLHFLFIAILASSSHVRILSL